MIHICRACSLYYPHWNATCLCCHAYGSIVPLAVFNTHRKFEKKKHQRLTDIPTRGHIENEDEDEFENPRSESIPTPITDVEEDETERHSTGIEELDRVLGGGFVRGGVWLLGGDPGVGKSTLLLQMLARCDKAGYRSLYVSGEEGEGPLAARAKRIGATSKNVLIYAESNLEKIADAVAENEPDVVIIDSAQMMRHEAIDTEPGSVLQLKKTATMALEWSRGNNCATFIVGHVTKDGTLAGPKAFEHLVDVVLQFEGEKTHAFRTLRASKNRFGSTLEVGIFEMTEKGMRGIVNPSEVFLKDRAIGVPGSVTACVAEGSRTMLVEVQALVTPSHGGSGSRMATGIDSGRLTRILSVLEHTTGYPLAKLNVIVNVIGGVRIDEPAIDLPIALAVMSSTLQKCFSEDTASFGEIGLSGEVRGAVKFQERFNEALAMGFKRVICNSEPAKKTPKLRVNRVKSLSTALLEAFGKLPKLVVEEKPKRGRAKR